MVRTAISDARRGDAPERGRPGGGLWQRPRCQSEQRRRQHALDTLSDALFWWQLSRCDNFARVQRAEREMCEMANAFHLQARHWFDNMFPSPDWRAASEKDPPPSVE